MELVEAVRVVAIAATAVVTWVAIEAALACHWLGRHAGLPVTTDDLPSARRGGSRRPPSW